MPDELYTAYLTNVKFSPPLQGLATYLLCLCLLREGREYYAHYERPLSQRELLKVSDPGL